MKSIALPLALSFGPIAKPFDPVGSGGTGLYIGSGSTRACAAGFFP